MKEIINDLSETLRPLAGKIKEAYIFGSFARDEEQYNDIDVLIIYKCIDFEMLRNKLMNIDFGRAKVLAPRNGYYDPAPSPPKPPKKVPFHIVLAEGCMENNPSLYSRVKSDLIAVPIPA